MGSVAFAGYSFIKKIEQNPAKLLDSGLVKTVVKSKLGDEALNLFTLAPHFLGFDRPRTFLILFLNNTEMRPGGGFIGSYATVRVNKGDIEILKVEGTETIDNASDRTKLLDPPQILKDQLKVKKWFFRDSNWSPDFAESSKRSLDFYMREQGIAADEIDTVIGVTTDVLEDFLALTGPVTVEGLEFKAEDVAETLEYEVEYGYRDRGLSFGDRKKIIRPFMYELLSRVGDEVFEKSDVYFDTIHRLAQEKHIVLYSNDVDLQKTIDELEWDGRMKEVEGDYLMWVDANLAALKTDHAIKRNLSRTLSPQDEGSFVGAATMKYEHTGGFDWRTTRYRTYARIFVPEGSSVSSVIISDSDGTGKVLTASKGEIDTGVENGKQWFGAFVVVEPGHTQDVSFIYNVAPQVRDDIVNGTYTLFVQKQIGTKEPVLTLDLNFGKNITSAEPAEEESEWGNAQYIYSTDLSVDREFKIGL